MVLFSLVKMKVISNTRRFKLNQVKKKRNFKKNKLLSYSFIFKILGPFDTFERFRDVLRNFPHFEVFIHIFRRFDKFCLFFKKKHTISDILNPETCFVTC